MLLVLSDSFRIWVKRNSAEAICGMLQVAQQW